MNCKICFENLKIQSFVAFLLLQIYNVTARKALEIQKIVLWQVVNGKGSRSCDEVKIVSSDKPSQNMLRQVYEMK